MAHDMVGGILLNTGHREEAIAHYRTAAAILPTDSGSNLAVAIYEQQHGDLQASIQHYRQALAGQDDYLEQAKIYQNMAVAYRDSGDMQKSVDCLKRAVKLRAAAAKIAAH
jgi:tetratricopeptide (TPR) repeat protein